MIHKSFLQKDGTLFKIKAKENMEMVLIIVQLSICAITRMHTF